MTNPKAYAGHTPGPYIVNGVHPTLGYWIIAHAVERNVLGLARGEADAQLFAAAPDLARENARLRQALAEMLRDYEPADGERNEEFPDSIILARAALAGKE